MRGYSYHLALCQFVLVFDDERTLSLCTMTIKGRYLVRSVYWLAHQSMIEVRSSESTLEKPW
ncbi:hypothetical protein L484_020768 [Morus notabilis]|uniref:Uncharacterized protein n=1 Tax=Morus notabilis TaxID=981085 RepID=W9RTJ9_9ROSA|nr:hypothetical protein L484_007932 [Morus notabilis]EXC11716.1 hypothetical protein L484_020768 [Morus notabilis]